MDQSGGNSESEEEKGPQVCSCKTKEPRDEVKATGLPANLAVLFVPFVEDLPFLCPAAPKELSSEWIPHVGCDPPRLLLAKYSRWLI